MLSFHKESFLRRLVLLVIPFLFWMFLFKDFLSGKTILNADTLANYVFVKYYLNNLLNGVVPLWEPFVFLGRPFVYILNAGLMNPLIYLIVFLKTLGVDYNQAYLIYLAVYYFVGLVGFYLLAKRLFQNEFYAFCAYILLLFSGMGSMLFNQFGILMVFFPAVWFFYFLFSFIHSSQRCYFLGIFFTLLLMTGSCYPFYFLTLFLIFLIFVSALFPKNVFKAFSDIFSFIKNNKLLTGGCCLAFIIAVTPLMLYALNDKGGEFISPTRHHRDCLINLEDCFQGSVMKYSDTAYLGTLNERMEMTRLFSHLNKAPYDMDSFFYIPFICYALIFISFFTVFDRQRLLLLGLIFIILLLSFGAYAPVYRLFYEHIFYFKYFRNLFFFMAFLIPLIILFSIAQFKAIIEHRINFPQRHIPLSIGIVLTGLAFFFILKNQGDILPSSYWTLIGTCALFSFLFYSAVFKNKILFGLLFMFLALLEPNEVFSYYQFNARYTQCDVPNKHVVPTFSFIRPRHNEKPPTCPYFEARDFNFESNMTFQDSDGYIPKFPGDIVSSWAYLMYLNATPETIDRYIHHKFVAYDYVMPWSDIPEIKRGQAFVSALENNKNLAFISTDEVPLSFSKTETFPKEDKSIATIISSQNDHFQVIHFDVNSLKLSTNFPQRKFLVYNDVYSKAWSVYINGKRDLVYRANIAFKGIWVPAGKNAIEFRYDPAGGQWIYLLEAGTIFLFFIFTFISFYRKNEYV
jgi:hypothetical protein